MTNGAEVELIRATEAESPVLANLLELYVHDFSEFLELQPGEDGRFGYPPLALYWTQLSRHALLIRVEGKLAGFALVKRGSEFTGNVLAWDMAEFFIVRGCRRRGVGTEAARRVWTMFPGPWEVRVRDANVPALRFWSAAISGYAGTAVEPILVERDGRRWKVFSFNSAAAAT